MIPEFWGGIAYITTAADAGWARVDGKTVAYNRLSVMLTITPSAHTICPTWKRVVASSARGVPSRQEIIEHGVHPHRIYIQSLAKLLVRDIDE
jgi:hypothetical protein